MIRLITSGKLLFIFLFACFAVFGKAAPASKASGIFLSIGVGPRLPIGSFATTSELGYGVTSELSYTDTDHLPFFVFARLGFEQYPGSQNFYQSSDYSNLSTIIAPAALGIRYYFSPLLERIVLLIPVIELSAALSYMRVLHEFKPGSGINNFKDELFKLGFSGGIGVSMFILEVLAQYTYFESNQYVSFNLNVRLPLIVNF